MDPSECNAAEPWSQDSKLFQPHSDHILLYEDAACKSVEAFLRICNLPFIVDRRINAEYMSPSGQVPFIKCGAFVISEFNPIVQFVGKKGISLSKKNDDSVNDMNTYLDMIDKVLANGEYYICWFDGETIKQHTWPRYSYFQPWPLDLILFYTKKYEVRKKLKSSTSLYNMRLNQVLEQMNDCLQALSNLLQDNNKFFYGRKPTELDALVYGHLSALHNCNLIGGKLKQMVEDYPNLLQFRQRIEETYFQTWNSNVK